MKKYAIIISAFLLFGCSSNENTSVTEPVTETRTAAITETRTERQVTATSEEMTEPTETTIDHKVDLPGDLPVTERKFEADDEVYAALRRGSTMPLSKYTVRQGDTYVTYDNIIYYYIDSVSQLPYDNLGEIKDEEDLIAKAREVFIAVLGQDYIDFIEADAVIIDGELIPSENRTSPKYTVNYSGEYDVWKISPCRPNTVLPEGQVPLPSPTPPPFLEIFGHNGQIIGCGYLKF